MITTNIMGGLGNQLFQIFNVINYSFTHKVPFFFENKISTTKDRPFYWDNLLLSLRPFLKNMNSVNMPIYKEAGFHYSELISYTNINRPFKFSGYFQSYKYFKSHETSIYRLIKIDEHKANVSSKYTQYKFDQLVSLHFRIGDYKNFPQHHPLVSIEYYISSLQYVISLTGRDDWNILYFYEEVDIEMVRINIDALQLKFKNLTFTPINTNIADYEQLLLMSLCQHNIIANSTFSWWGAYLNSNVSKIITYPSKWFGPALRIKNTTTLFPDEWHKIDV